MLSALLLAVVMSGTDCTLDQMDWQEQKLDSPCTLLTRPTALQIAAFAKSWRLSDRAAACARSAARLGERNPGSLEAWTRCIDIEPTAFALCRYCELAAEIWNELPMEVRATLMTQDLWSYRWNDRTHRVEPDEATKIQLLRGQVFFQ